MTTSLRGNSESPALVLLHGAVLNGQMWRPVVDALGDDFRILTPDLPGHGMRAHEPFRLPVAVVVVQEVVRALAPTPVILVGDSLGGYVAIATAPTLGDQLRGAVLAGCTARCQGPFAWTYDVQIALTRLMPPATLMDRLTRRIARDYAAGPAVLEAGIRPAAFAEGVAELRQFDFHAALARLNIPILLVNGTRDWQHRLGERSSLAAAPRASLRHIPGVGHGVSLTRPAIFASLIRQFVTAVPVGSPLVPK